MDMEKGLSSKFTFAPRVEDDVDEISGVLVSPENILAVFDVHDGPDAELPLSYRYGGRNEDVEGEEVAFLTHHGGSPLLGFVACVPSLVYFERCAQTLAGLVVIA